LAISFVFLSLLVALTRPRPRNYFGTFVHRRFSNHGHKKKNHRPKRSPALKSKIDIEAARDGSRKEHENTSLRLLFW
jgi:hypothetical protein